MAQNIINMNMDSYHEWNGECDAYLDNQEDQSYNVIVSCFDDFSAKCLGQIDSLNESLKTKEAQKKIPSKTSNQWIGLRLNTQIKNRQSLGVLLYTAKIAQMHSDNVPIQLEQDILRQLRKLNILEIPVKSMKKTNRRVRIEQILMEQEGESKIKNAGKSSSELFESQNIKLSIKNLSFLSQRFEQFSEGFQAELDRLEQPQQVISSAENDKKLRLQFNSNHVLVILDLIENILAILRFLQDTSSEIFREELLVRIYSSGSLKLRVPNHSIGKVKPKYIETIFSETDKEEENINKGEGICEDQEEEEVGDINRMNEDSQENDRNESRVLNQNRNYIFNTCNEDSSIMIFQSQYQEENIKEESLDDSNHNNNILLKLSLPSSTAKTQILSMNPCNFFDNKINNLVYSQEDSSHNNLIDSFPHTELSISLASTEFSFSEVYF